MAPSAGVSFPNLLDHNNADIAATSQNGSTYLYHYSGSAQPAIREIIITGTPASSDNNQEAYNITSPPVAIPNLAITTTTSSPNATNQPPPYRPLAASNNAVQTLPGQIYVFWADKPTGDPVDPTGLSGFAELVEISRQVGNGTWPSTASEGIQVPLGSSNSQPNEKRRRAWGGRVGVSGWVGWIERRVV